MIGVAIVYVLVNAVCVRVLGIDGLAATTRARVGVLHARRPARRTFNLAGDRADHARDS